MNGGEGWERENICGYRSGADMATRVGNAPLASTRWQNQCHEIPTCSHIRALVQNFDTGTPASKKEWLFEALDRAVQDIITLQIWNCHCTCLGSWTGQSRYTPRVAIED